MKSPYYFVPLNKEVFYPSWADRVSHDIPFSDGECGEIEIKVTAHKPIFIRNSYEEGEHHKGKEEYYINKDGESISTEFYHFVKNEKKRYLIPGSSLRNMIKNKLRILCFGEIKTDELKHNNKLSISVNRKREEFDYTINNAIKQIVKVEKLDLASAIFGCSSKNYSLAGRVNIGHIFADEEAEKADSLECEILGTPKETFYPSYIRQTNTNNGKVIDYTTLNHKEAEIAGYKFYPLQNTIQTNPPTDKNKNVATYFRPLKENTVFNGTIRYQNLRKEELGALLSALTFHGQEDTHHHNIGMAKPLGYGEISISITNINSVHNKEEISLNKNNIKEYLDAFEKMMNRNNKEEWSCKSSFTSWNKSNQYRELFSIFNTSNKQNLKYLQLQKPTGQYNNKGKERKLNEFGKVKIDKEYLRLYSEMFGDDNAVTEKKSENIIKKSNPKQKPKSSKIEKKYRYDIMATRIGVSCPVLEAKADELGIVLNKNENNQKKLILEKDIAKLEKALKDV